MTSLRLLRPLTVALLSLGAAVTAEAQQAAEQSVPAGSASARRQPPAPTFTGSGPNGATLRCRDGSYPPAMAADDACANKGGVLVRFPMRATARPIEAATAPTVRASTPAMRSTADSTRPEGFVPWRERRAQDAAEAARLRPPADATLRCGDGTWIARDTSSARCSGRGGVTLRIPTARGRRGA